MADLSTIYKLTFKQGWGGTGGKPQENVFFFEHTAGVGNAEDLATDFAASYIPAINAIQCASNVNVGLDVVNMEDLGDFTSPVVTGAGAYAVQPLPPYAAVGYTMKVNTRAVRKGSKRFSGVPETVSEGGLITDGTYRTKVDDLRLILQQELVSADNTWLPVVIKRVKEAVAGTTPTQYTYRLPVNDAELVIGEVVVVLTTDILSHQVSREV
jgi:hypothetical protein